MRMKTRTIKQSVSIAASPHAVYEALMDSKKHSEFTGGKAKTSRRVGGKFEAYDGWIDGWNVALLPDKKIVQKWRGGDWPKGHYSTVTFFLKKTPAGSLLQFTQTDVPEEHFEDISQGWIDNYWDKMKTALDGQ